MKSILDYINESSNDGNVNESLLIAAAAAAAVIAGAAAAPALFDKITSRIDARKTRRLASKMQRLEMLRQANNREWADFFDVAAHFGPDTLQTIMRADPDMRQAMADIDKDEEIARLTRELEDARSSGDTDTVGDLLRKIGNRLTKKQAELFARASEKLAGFSF